jgi:paired small multidrug resistance pump
MSKNWVLVVIAAVFEVMWVAGLKHADNFYTWLLTIVAFVISFAVLIYSGKKLPTSTVYAIFVGLGTAGTVLSEMIWFSVPFSWIKVLLIFLLLTGIIGLKMVSHEHKERDLKEGDIA